MPYATSTQTQTHTKGIHNAHDLPVTMTNNNSNNNVYGEIKSKGREPSLSSYVTLTSL